MSVFRHSFRGPRAPLGALMLLLGVGLVPLTTGKSVAQGMKDMRGMENSKPAASATAKATGTVTALNAADRKVTLDHGAIPAIKWPPMKMEFAVAPNVDLSKVTTGEKVDFTLSGSGSSYTVQSITPAK
ncbi:copper-binding protein [Bradyrhizobium niftali]|uniref:Copper-binding protein n=2 Tax=Bradyrhizobium niftali TaxID=2560055 RepID=A0A4Y9LLQ4_9BRAD|nr:copper-binding protein [Bradyrhizobium niftali]